MLFGFSYQQIAVVAGIFVASALVSTAIVGAYLVLLHPEHFVAERSLAQRIRSPVLATLYVVGKNLLGLVLVVVGIMLSLPGVPGQGLLTVLVGILLLDIPGKRRLELRLVKRPAIKGTIDKLRARFGRPPIATEVADSMATTDDATRQ